MYLDFLQPYHGRQKQELKELSAVPAMRDDNLAMGQAVELSAPIVQMNENQLATDFDITFRIP